MNELVDLPDFLPVFFLKRIPRYLFSWPLTIGTVNNLYQFSWYTVRIRKIMFKKSFEQTESRCWVPVQIGLEAMPWRSCLGLLACLQAGVLCLGGWFLGLAQGGGGVKGRAGLTSLPFQVMEAFYARVAAPESSGAIFLAVCRGKVSLQRLGLTRLPFLPTLTLCPRRLRALDLGLHHGQERLVTSLKPQVQQIWEAVVLLACCLSILNVVLGWCKSNCGFALLHFAIWYWNTFFNKCGYVMHHFNAQFSLFFC